MLREAGEAVCRINNHFIHRLSSNCEKTGDGTGLLHGKAVTLPVFLLFDRFCGQALRAGSTEKPAKTIPLAGSRAEDLIAQADRCSERVSPDGTAAGRMLRPARQAASAVMAGQCGFHLLHGLGFDLADALSRHTVFVGQILQRSAAAFVFVPQPA